LLWVVSMCVFICLVLWMDMGSHPWILCTWFFFYLGFLTCIWLFLHMGANCFVFIGFVGGEGGACWTRVIMNVWHPISYWFLETRMDLMDEETSSCVAWPSFKVGLKKMVYLKIIIYWVICIPKFCSVLNHGTFFLLVID
jgi:hypothetical protein